MVVSLWKHELIRTVRDRITQTADLNWFDEKLGGIITTVSNGFYVINDFCVIDD